MELSVVVPVYEEEENISVFLSEIEKILTDITDNYEIIFSVDPSRDKTAEQIVNERKRNGRVKYLIFSRRIGQPIATLAGIEHAQGDAVVVMDVDLQDPPEVIVEMVEKWRQGYDVIYGVRRSRAGENFVKRAVSYLGYKIINRIADVEIPRNAGDFRLMNRRVVNDLLRLSETHGFLRGMVALVGYRQTFVEFDRYERFSGKRKYNRFLGSVRIGVNGVVGFSSYPLYMSSILGIGFVLTAFILFIYLQFLVQDSNWIIVFRTELGILFLGGIQLIAVGILGEYIGRIYDEVKRRPRYFVAEKVGFVNEDRGD